MNKKIGLLVSALILNMLPVNYYLSNAYALSFWDNKPDEELAGEIIDAMTPTELYSQVLMFGWREPEPPQILYDWVERGLGSVKIFGWYTDELPPVARSIASLQTKASQGRFQIPLFVATDQEGGWIRHVKGDTSITPGNMAIGAAGFPNDAFMSAYYISREIRVLGINMNFAPTVDLFTNHDSTIIGARSFGDDPVKSGILGVAWAAGSTAAGIIPTVKHFPGHGDTADDSHGTKTKINVDFETFKNRELIPFMYLIDSGVPAVMSGHLTFPQIDPTGTPASLSSFFLKDLLRGQLGYKGLIITDDIMMNGATMYAGSLTNAFRMALQAGNDIVLSSKVALLNEGLWTTNLDLMSTDEEFYASVKEAAYHVLLAKLKYFKGENPAPLFPNPEDIPTAIPDPDGEKFFLEQACRSITVYKGETPLLPENAGRVLFMGPKSYYKDFKNRYPNSGDFNYELEPGPNQTQWVIDNIKNTASSYDTIIILVLNDRTVRIAESLKGFGKRIIVLSLMSPVFGEKVQWADTVLMGYSWSGYTLKAMAGLLAGEYNPVGLTPFK